MYFHGLEMNLVFFCICAEVDGSGNRIPGDPFIQPSQTPSSTVQFETPPVRPTGALIQPTSKHKAQEPCKRRLR